MPNFVHIDIAADDPERATRFYERVFGWKIQKLEGPVPYWLISTGEGMMPPVGAGVARREQPWQSVTPTIDVDSVDAYKKKIVAEGGTVVAPKALIPGIGYLLSFKDTEGNIFAILEAVPGNPFAG
jgi:hypothetical protein